MGHPQSIRSRQRMRHDGGKSLKYQGGRVGRRALPLKTMECETSQRSNALIVRGGRGFAAEGLGATPVATPCPSPPRPYAGSPSRLCAFPIRTRRHSFCCCVCQEGSVGAYEPSPHGDGWALGRAPARDRSRCLHLQRRGPCSGVRTVQSRRCIPLLSPPAAWWRHAIMSLCPSCSRRRPA